MSDRGESGRLAPIVEALRAGQAGAALTACATLLGETPQDAALLHLAALAAFRAAKLELARTYANRALGVQPDHAPLLLLAGRIAAAGGHHAEAGDALFRFCEQAPVQAEPAFLLCLAWLKAGDPRSDSVLRSLLERFPDHAEGWDSIGGALYEAGQREAALLCFDRVLATTPSFAAAMRCGLLRREVGRTAEAIEAFRQAAAIEPGADRAAFLLGVCLQDLREFAAAAEAYRAALGRNPALAEAAVNLGTVLQEIGDLDGARLAYARAVQARPDTFGRVAQAITTAPKGELWLDLGAFRAALED